MQAGVGRGQEKSRQVHVVDNSEKEGKQDEGEQRTCDFQGAARAARQRRRNSS